MVFYEILVKFNVKSTCSIRDDELLCQGSQFCHYNSSSIHQNLLTHSQTLHLTNSYYSGILDDNVHKLIIDNYPYRTFPLPFISLSTLSFLYIEHTFVTEFPTWLCRHNQNLTIIVFDYSHIEKILEHDLHLCLHLHTLHLTNSYLKQFTNINPMQLSVYNLNLNHNKIQSISTGLNINFEQFPHLNILDLSYNDIKTISTQYFYQTKSLITLDLSYCNLELFQFDNYNYLTSLQILNLNANLNLVINKNWSDYLPHLTKIHLPYAHFCCNFKSKVHIFNDKYQNRFDIDHDRLELINEKEKQYTNEKKLLSISYHSNQICFPLPDEMTPCESLFSSKYTRSIFLIIIFISFMSNLTALTITAHRLITSTYNRCSISILLSLNLALADFISSIYLILIGILDFHFQENFYNKTQLWIDSSLCKFAGFIYIFGIQSSIYALALLTFERFYTILFSFKRQTTWPSKFILISILFGWLLSSSIALLPLININNFHANSLCVPFRMQTIFDRLYLSLLIIFDICFLCIIATCNGLICFNFSKSHIHTINDARATLKILTLVITICLSRIPLIIFIFVALIVRPTSTTIHNSIHLHFNDIKLAVLFLQPLSSCFNPFMYSFLSTLKWTKRRTYFNTPKRIRKSMDACQFRTRAYNYFPLRMMSITSLDYRFSSLSNTS